MVPCQWARGQKNFSIACFLLAHLNRPLNSEPFEMCVRGGGGSCPLAINENINRKFWQTHQ